MSLPAQNKCTHSCPIRIRIQETEDSRRAVTDRLVLQEMWSTILLYVLVIIKCEGRPLTCHRRHRGGVNLLLCSFLTSALDGGGCSTPRPGRFTLAKELRYPLYRRLNGSRGPVWTVVEKRKFVCMHRVSNLPGSIELLYRLSYSGPACHRLRRKFVLPLRRRLM